MAKNFHAKVFAGVILIVEVFAELFVWSSMLLNELLSHTPELLIENTYPLKLILSFQVTLKMITDPFLISVLFVRLLDHDGRSESLTVKL